MSSLLTLAKDLEQQSKAQQQSTGEMLKAAFSEHEQSVRAELSASARRISDAILAHEQSRGLTLSGTKTHVKQRFLPLTPLLMVSDVLWSPVLPA
ncbi:MbeB family mobilization protein [Enterobacter kobei]|uniref:MbeB family mobilization protein n=1 Tax=Enterobacter kobei TaxID=208224 RepID=UPI003970C5BB